jgi:hypothetical protein
MARYDAFLLRIWQQGDARHAQVAVQLQHLPDGDTLRFGSLAALTAHLTCELGAEDDGSLGAYGGDPAEGVAEGGRS